MPVELTKCSAHTFDTSSAHDCIFETHMQSCTCLMQSCSSQDASWGRVRHSGRGLKCPGGSQEEVDRHPFVLGIA